MSSDGISPQLFRSLPFPLRIQNSNSNPVDPDPTEILLQPHLLRGYYSTAYETSNSQAEDNFEENFEECQYLQRHSCQVSQ